MVIGSEDFGYKFIDLLTFHEIGTFYSVSDDDKYKESDGYIWIKYNNEREIIKINTNRLDLLSVESENEILNQPDNLNKINCNLKEIMY